MEGGFFLDNWFYEGMRWLSNNVTASVFLTILLATIVMKLITLPLDIKSRKSSLKMSALQPQIDKLKKKYAGNPQKLQQEQSKLMKTNGVSMMAGCLPMILTMVFFICFLSSFRIWSNEKMVSVAIDINRGIQTEEAAGTDMGTDAEYLQSFKATKWLWVNNIWQPDTMASVIMDKATFEKIQIDNMTAFDDETVEYVKNEVIPNYDKIEAKAKSVYSGKSNGWFLLPLLAGAAMFLSSYVTMKMTPNQASTEKTGKMMMYLFPVIGIIAGLQSSAAFAIYWVISSLISMFTQIGITKIYMRKSTTDSTQVEEA